MLRRTTLIPTLIALTALLLAACTASDGTVGGGHGVGGHDETSRVAEGARKIEVLASSFRFDPDEITVTAGEDIAIVLTSTDVLHDFVIDELRFHVGAGANKTVEGGLRADKPGEYTFYCSVHGHRRAGMAGTLIVEAS